MSVVPAVVLRGVRTFRAFRRTRPFWAALWCCLGGFTIAYAAYGPINVIIHAGLAGIFGLGLGSAICALALIMLALPSQRYVVSVLIAVMGVASFPLTNLGGFFFGMFFSVLGASMGFAWMPEKPAPKRRLFRRVAPTLVLEESV